MGKIVLSAMVVMMMTLAGCSKESKEQTTKPVDKPTAARAKTPTPQPEPPPQPATTPTCSSKKDCRVTCDLPNSCCGQLCDCTKPYHKDQLPAMRKANEALCAKNPGCPKADCAKPVKDHVPACLSGKCVAAVYPAQTRCTQDSDCQLYCFDRGDCLGQTCGPCRHAFHKSDMPAIETWRTTNCTNKGPWHARAKCSRAAMNTAPVCKQGRCTVKNVPWK